MATNSGYPKLKIKSDNPFFCTQINRIIMERELLVDVVDSDVNKADIGIYDYVPDSSEFDLMPYLFLILDRKQEKELPKDDIKENVHVFKSGSLRESEIADDIQNVSYTIIANNKASYGFASIAKELKNEQERTSDYETALLKSGEAQKMIMLPRFKDEMFDIHVVYEPYRDVSGDVLFIQKIYEKIFIMVADVTDHGYLAGMYGASLYALANNYVQHSSVMEQSVDAWSQYMVKASKMFQPYGLDIGNPMMVRFTANALFCIIDTKECKASFTFYGSGQEPPIIVKGGHSAKIFSISDGIGAPLGDLETPAKVHKKKFFPGDSIIFFTDGATEIFANATEDKDVQKIYSVEKIEKSANAALSNKKKSPKDIIEFILKDASAYSIAEDLESDANMPNITDDLTIMCIKWEGENID